MAARSATPSPDASCCERFVLKNLKDAKDARDAMLSLLPTSGTLAGIAVGLAGVLNAGGHNHAPTWADDFLLLSALGFLLVCYLIFFAIRDLHSESTSRLRSLIDIVFLGSMTLMVFAGFVVVYEFL